MSDDKIAKYGLDILNSFNRSVDETDLIPRERILLAATMIYALDCQYYNSEIDRARQIYRDVRKALYETASDDTDPPIGH